VKYRTHFHADVVLERSVGFGRGFGYNNLAGPDIFETSLPIFGIPHQPDNFLDLVPFGWKLAPFRIAFIKPFVRKLDIYNLVRLINQYMGRIRSREARLWRWTLPSAQAQNSLALIQFGPQGPSVHPGSPVPPASRGACRDFGSTAILGCSPSTPAHRPTASPPNEQIHLRILRFHPPS
jgi:hypothetical protein